MKKILIFIPALCTLSLLNFCKDNDKNPTDSSNISKENSKDYPQKMAEIEQKNIAERKKYFYHYVNDDVPKYWSGTPWSFNGTVQNPGKKPVACGYFVTHVLENYGFRIRATYLAQQASSVMINQICTEIKHFNSVEKLGKYIKSQPDKTIYIVGLDFHTGFISRDGDNVYFIHSNYIKNQGPVKEKIEDSKALNASKTFMVGKVGFKFLK